MKNNLDNRFLKIEKYVKLLDVYNAYNYTNINNKRNLLINYIIYLLELQIQNKNISYLFDEIDAAICLVELKE